MADEALFKLSDAAIVLATLAGPVLAIQIQKLLERNREHENKQFQVFESLMATRASRMSERHVDALNAIPIAFHGKNARLVRIRTEWNGYLKHLGDKHKQTANENAWRGEQIPKIVSLIFEMSEYLGYNFTKEEIENGIYFPEGHGAVEMDRQIVLDGFAKIFKGEFGFPIWVNNLHQSETKPKQGETGGQAAAISATSSAPKA